jgi:hypothetical protein
MHRRPQRDAATARDAGQIQIKEKSRSRNNETNVS